MLARGAISIASRTRHGGLDQRVWACRRGDARRLLVFHGFVHLYGGETARGFAVHGDFVAFSVFNALDHYGTHAIRVKVVNVRTRHTRSDALLNTVPPGLGFRVGPLSWSSDGLVAVRSVNAVEDTEPAEAIQLVDGTKARILDIGAPGSLSNPVTAGTTVTWTHAGIARSAELRGG